MTKIAVLLLNYNGKELASKCLDSFLNQNSNQFDIYFIDNGSDDDSIKFIKNKFIPLFKKRLKLVRIENNVGFTGGYNYLLKKNKSIFKNYKYIILVSNDVVVSNNYISEINRVFEIDNKIGMVGPAVVTNNKIIDSCGGLMVPFSGTNYGFMHGEKYVKADNIYSAFWLSGCAIAIKVNLLYKIGLFPNYFFYFEDIFLCWRALNLKYKIVSTLNAYVVHEGSPSKKNTAEFAEKNRLICFWQNTSALFFYLNLPIYIVTRAAIIFIYSKSFIYCFARLKGIFFGLMKYKQYPKFSTSFLNDIKNIKSMCLIEELKY